MTTPELLLQTRRRANLRHLIQSLENEGIQSWSAQADLLANISGPELQNVMQGANVSDVLAREIEWSMHRPEGWLDRQPEDMLDD